jgi:hypothetical protein
MQYMKYCYFDVSSKVNYYSYYWNFNLRKEIVDVSLTFLWNIYEFIANEPLFPNESVSIELKRLNSVGTWNQLAGIGNSPQMCYF